MIKAHRDANTGRWL